MSSEAVFTSSLTRSIASHRNPQRLCVAPESAFFKMACANRILLAGARSYSRGPFLSMSTTFLLIGYPAVAVAAWLIFRSVLGVNVAPPAPISGKNFLRSLRIPYVALYCVLETLVALYTQREASSLLDPGFSLQLRWRPFLSLS